MNRTIVTVNDLNWKSDALGELRHVSFCLQRGKIVGLLGMDGSGTQPLLHLLAGRHEYSPLPPRTVYSEQGAQMDGIRLRQITRLINMEEETIENWTLAEYLNMANAGVFLGLGTWRKMKQTTEEWFREYGYEVDPEALMGTLGELQRRIARICRALMENAEILLIEDECIGMSEQEIQAYVAVIRKTADRGKAVVIRSQSVRMIRLVSDSIMILRRGRLVKCAPNAAALTAEEIHDCLLGETMISRIRNLGSDRYSRREDTRLILRVRNIPVNGKRKELLFWEGEIVYLLIRNKQQKQHVFDLLSCRKTDSQVSYILDEVAIRPHLREFSKKKIVSADIGNSMREMFPAMSSEDNLLIPSLKKFSSAEYFMQSEALKKAVSGSIPEEGKENSLVQIRRFDQNERIRLIMEKWKIYNPRVLILYEPFAYCDAYGVSMMSSYIKQFAADGTSVIIVKSPGAEVEELADRMIDLED